MTPGQARALNELQRLQAAAPDSFTILGEPRIVDGRLLVTVSIRLGPIESEPGGLELLEREEFTVHIPQDFPFTYPRLTVEHDRFGGFPHVVWIHTICLYRSATDWNPQDGMYGFFERLRQWLGKAAVNDMDPVDAPLEPPHHVTDISQVPFVVRANAPARPGQFWIGFAQLEKHSNRTELVGWTELAEDWPPDKTAALAIMLPRPLPMEFPERGEDFFRELAKQDIDSAGVIRFLACAAALTPSEEPIHLVLGMPMRRAPDGSPRLHIAVWTTSPEFGRALRLLLQQEGDTARIKEIRKELADTVYGLLKSHKIFWCRILEDRPEIVLRRDRGSPASWFFGKKVLLLGCGALGSWIGEIVARSGAAAIHLVDNAIVKPGLLARQNFQLQDIGADKSQALADRLRSLSAEIQCEAFPREAHAFIAEDPSRLRSYDVVIDCTASSVLQMKLERDWLRFQRSTPPIISVGIDATARRFIVVTVPANASGGIWDAYVQLKLRLCIANTNRQIIQAFYEESPGRHMLQPEPGCSDPTFAGSTADVAGLAATALNLAVPLVEANPVPSGLAFSAPPPSTSRMPSDVLTLANLEEVRVGHYRIRVAPTCIAKPPPGYVTTIERAQNTMKRAECFGAYGMTRCSLSGYLMLPAHLLTANMTLGISYVASPAPQTSTSDGSPSPGEHAGLLVCGIRIPKWPLTKV